MGMLNREKEKEILNKIENYKKRNPAYDSVTNLIQLQALWKDCLSKNFDVSGNVLFLSDRLFGVALGLQCLFEAYTQVNACGVATSYENALALTKNHKIDVLIIVGYQKMKYNYEIINYLKKRDNTRTVMWAVLDQYIDTVCRQYHIEYKFNRTDSLDLFVEYLVRSKLLGHYL